MTPAEFLKFKLRRVCINELPSNLRYKREALDTIAKKARDEGHDVFYYRPVIDGDWGGEIIESEPIYKYKSTEFVLTESEYRELFGEEEPHEVVRETI